MLLCQKERPTTVNLFSGKKAKNPGQSNEKGAKTPDFLLSKGRNDMTIHARLQSKRLRNKLHSLLLNFNNKLSSIYPTRYDPKWSHFAGYSDYR